MPSLVSALSTLATLSSIVFAVPINTRQTTGGNAFQLIPLSSTDFLNNVPLAASSGELFLGVPTSARCLPSAFNCAQYSITSIIVDSLSNEAGMRYLYTRGSFWFRPLCDSPQ